jgi:DNA-binding MarR family transcriptional regulator
MQSAKRLVESARRARRLHTLAAKALRPYNLTPALWSVLSAIVDSPGITMAQLSKELEVSHPFVTTSVGALKELSLVRLERTVNDKRIRCAYFNPRKGWFDKVEKDVQEALDAPQTSGQVG